MTRATSCSSAPSSEINSVGAVLLAGAAIFSVSGGIGQLLLEFGMREAGARGGVDAGDAAEGRADAHADAGRIALAEHVAGHHLAGRKQILARHIVEAGCRGVVGLQAEIGEGDAGLLWFGVVWSGFVRLCFLGLGWCLSLGA